ncbi:restriction endonuclease subunit S [Clostridium perfringens]
MMSRNVPKLRFKGFEDEWKKYELDDIAMISKSKYNPTKSNKTYKCIELEHIAQEDGRILGYVNSKEQNSIKNKFDSGDILFGKLRPYLKKYWISNFEGVCSSEIWVLKARKISNSFLYRIVQSEKFNNIANVSSGSKMPRADWNYMSSTIFLVPKLNEQEKIANFLSKVDSIIEKQEKKVEYWNSYKKGMMQKIFSQKIRFKDENGRDYPEWKINKIENIATIEMGFTPSTKNDEAWNGNIEWLSIAGMNSKYIYSGNKKISSEILGKRKLVPIDTLIMSFKLTIGRLAIVKKEIVTNEAICQFYWKSKDISNEYMYAYLSVINIESFGCRAAKGITLNTESLNSIVVKLPCLEEQTKIANFLSNIDNIIEKESKKLEELKQWKKGLLQQMFV